MYPKDHMFAQMFRDSEEWERERWLRGKSSTLYYNLMFSCSKTSDYVWLWALGGGGIFESEAHNGGLMGNFGHDKGNCWGTILCS